MKEIEFSTMFDITASPGMGGAFFDEFAARNHLNVNASQIAWGEAWNKLVQFGLGSHGPDVSEIWSYTPAHLDALAQSPLANIPFYPAIQQSLKDGRSCYSGHRWSGVEIRLAETIEQLWRDLHAHPDLNIAQEVDKRFSTLCARLEQTILASSW